MDEKMRKGTGGAADTGVPGIKKSVVEPTRMATPDDQTPKFPSEIKNHTPLNNLVSDNTIPVESTPTNKVLEEGV